MLFDDVSRYDMHFVAAHFQFVYDGCRIGDLQFLEFVGRQRRIDARRQRAKTCAVSDDEHVFTRFECGYKRLFPIRINAGDRIFKAFRLRYQFFVNVRITRVAYRRAGIVERKGRRRNIIAASPNIHLIFADCGGDFVPRFTFKIAVR